MTGSTARVRRGSAAAVLSAVLLVPAPAAEAHPGKAHCAAKAAAKSRGAGKKSGPKPTQRGRRAKPAGRKNH